MLAYNLTEAKRKTTNEISIEYLPEAKRKRQMK